jgi:hypothetical protein
MKTKNLFFTAALLGPLCCFAETKSDSQPTGVEPWIAFLPVIFYGFILLVLIFKLKKGNIGLSDLIAEKDPSAKAVVVNNTNTAANPPQSVSRFIAFLTGLVALTIAVCLTTFFIYNYFNTSGKTVDLSNLTTVIWGLGIGVIPYGANKVSSALKSNN